MAIFEISLLKKLVSIKFTLIPESNASFTNFSTEKRVTDKPPKPLKPNQASDSDDNLIGPTSSDHENDVSTVSVHINEDDLKQFEGDLTLAENEEEEEDDDADCDDDKENQNIPSRQSDQGFKLGLTGRNKQFSFLTNSIASHHANDLTNVSEATFFDFDDGRFKSTVSEEVSMSNLVSLFRSLGVVIGGPYLGISDFI